MSERPPVAPDDLAIITEQLQRPARGVLAVAARCPSGHPAVVETAPRLPDGTPFPTTFYVTCPRLAGAIGSLEATGIMSEMSERVATDPALADAYRHAHEVYLAHRESIGHVPEIDGISAGGMPTRVKCLHVLVGHALASGAGVNPIGDETIGLLADRWPLAECATAEAP